jgi:hypothetical protein
MQAGQLASIQAPGAAAPFIAAGLLVTVAGGRSLGAPLCPGFVTGAPGGSLSPGARGQRDSGGSSPAWSSAVRARSAPPSRAIRS